MIQPLYLLDLAVLAELTRPDGNRRIFTLFQQRQGLCAIAAPVAYALLRGIDRLPEKGPRRAQLSAFAAELLRSGPSILPFSGEAAIWLARQAPRWESQGRSWLPIDGEQAAIVATQNLSWVTRGSNPLAATPGLRIDDWFRP